MSDIEKNGSLFIGGSADAGDFRGWRPSDIPRDDLIVITKAVDVAQGYDPSHDPFVSRFADALVGNMIGEPGFRPVLPKGLAPGYYQIEGMKRHRAEKRRRAIKVRP